MKKLYTQISNLIYCFQVAGLFMLILLFFFLLTGKTFAQCSVPADLVSSNLTVSSAIVSWESIPNVDYYRVSLRQQGASTWQFATNPVNIDPSSTSIALTTLEEYTTYEWRIRSWCQDGFSSTWSAVQSFTTLSSFPIDCNGDPNGTAFIDSCDNCVGGNTGSDPCISFSPTIAISLNSQEVGSITDLTFEISQDPMSLI